MTMCTVKEIQEAIREDCKSQHDMESTDIDRVMQTLPFAQEEPFTEARPRKPLFWFKVANEHREFRNYLIITVCSLCNNSVIRVTPYICDRSKIKIKS